MSAQGATQGSAGRRQRKLKNLLLDPGFQLKYTGYLVAATLLISLSLGGVLWKTSSQVVSQSEQSVKQGTQIVSLGREVIEESRKVSAVVRMNIVKDPVYQNDPELLKAFNTDAAVQDQRLEAQWTQLEVQSQALVEQAENLRRFQSTLLWSIVWILGLLVVVIGLVGIFVTHKVAGPVFKMKRQFGELASGSLKVPSGLRKGDELIDFFAEFRSMVSSLRTERQKQLELLEEAMSEPPSERLERLEALRTSLRAGLD